MSHYTDDPARRGYVRTLCRQLLRVDRTDWDFHAPTCPRCAAALAAREAEPENPTDAEIMAALLARGLR